MDTAHSPRFRWATLALILGAAMIRLAYLAFWCPLDLAPDEAYYWDWSRHLDWSYHSKGPLVAWLIRLSCTCFGDTMLGVRLPAVVCGSLLLFGLFTLTRNVYQSDRLAFTLVALALTLPIIAAGSMLMTIDAPFTCVWMWACVFAHRAIFAEARWAWWAAGVCILIGILAKHTMVLWPISCGLFLLLVPAFRVELRRPGWWIMIGIGALGIVPILAWNAVHGWVTLEHTQYHAGIDDEQFIDWLGPFRYLGGQVGVLLGFWFLAWIIAMWRQRPTVEQQPQLRFLWWMSAPTFVFFGVFAFKNGGGQPNWPVTAYLTGMILAAGWLARQQASWVRASIAGFAALGLLATAILHQPPAFQPIFLNLAGPATPERPTPMRRIDPTCRLRGWRYLAAEVDRVRAELKGRGLDPVLAAERWTQAAELAFYCEEQPHFYYLGLPLGDRVCQYDLWRPNPIADPDVFKGRAFLLIGQDAHLMLGAFDSSEEIRTITYNENGQPIAQWTMVIAHGFRGWR